jgi:hypothetical protein
MRRFPAILLSAILSISVAGCRSANAPAPPPAPGYSSSIDQSLGQTLAAADAFYNRLQTDAKAGTFKPTSDEVAALNRLQAALAAANPLYLAYHNGTGSLQATQTSVDAVSAAETNVQTLVGGR